MQFWDSLRHRLVRVLSVTALLGAIATVAPASAQTPASAPIVTDQAGLATSEQFGFPNQWKLTDRGDVLFTSGFNTALFRWNQASGNRERLLQTNDTLDKVLSPLLVALLPPGMFVDLPALSLNVHPSSGKTVFAVSVVEAGEPEPIGILVHDGVSYRLILADLANILQQAVNSAGRVAVAGYPDVLANGPLQLWLETPSGDLKLLAQFGSPSPAGLGGTVSDITLLGITEAGRAIYLLAINGGSTPLAVLSSDGTNTQVIVRSNDPVEAGGRLNLRPGAANYMVNDAGDVAFASDANGGPSGIWLASASAAPAAAIRQNDATGTPLGGSFSGSLVLRGFNNDGQVLFSSNISGGSSNLGLFLKDRGASAKVIFSRGQTAEALGRFDAPMQASLSASGKVAFLSSLTGSSSSVAWFLGAAGAEPVKIAAEGEKSPSGGWIGLTDNNLPALINASGQVVFAVDLVDTGAAALLSWTADRGLANVVSHLDTLPSGANEVLRPLTGNSNFRSESEIIVRSLRAGGRATYYAVDSTGTGASRKIVAEGDELPQGGVGLSFGAMSLNAKGEALFLAQVLAPSRYPLTTLLANRPDSGLQSIISLGDDLPGGGKLQGFTTPQLNSLSQFVFTANTDLPTGNQMYLGSLYGPVLKRLAGMGDPVANAGTQTVSNVTGNLAFSETGLVAVLGTISGPNRPAIFAVNPDSTVSKIAAAGDSAPSGTFGGFPPQLRINSDGKVAFVGNFPGGPGVFVGSASNPPQPVALGGAAAPGLSGFRFGGFNAQSLSINSSGQVAFWSVLCCAAPASGWFVGTPGAEPKARIYTGQALPAGGTAGFVAFAGRTGFLSDSGDLAAYVAEVNGSDKQPQIVISDTDAKLRPLAAGGEQAPAGLGILGKPNPVIYLTPAGRFIFSSLLSSGPPKAGLFTSLP
ncbi:MAG: hypothetical protein HY821_04730 [Acidobacteria bacterium]|nr:hypothetical protein [Acidobacteriota bacterium]